MENFSSTIINDVIIESIRVKRATREEAEEFKIRMQKHIDDGFRKLIVDLEQCEFVDSIFLSTLLIALKISMKKGGNLKLASPKHDVAEVLEATGMNRVFDIYPNISDAISSFNTF